MSELSSDLLDRYLRGETSQEEQRALVQQSMHDQDLFDVLTTIGLARAALREARSQPTAGAVFKASPTRALHWRRFAVPVWAGVAAAVLLLAVLTRFAIDRAVPAARPSSADQASSTTPGATSIPVAEVRHPVFLAARLEIPASSGRNPRFRAGDSARQLAKASGSVLSADAGIARLDVGAIDGLVKGSIVMIEPEPSSTGPELRATVTTVFRDEARVEVAGDVRPGQQVRLEPTTHLQALSTLIADGTAAGDVELVRAAATRASAVARMSDASADVRRVVFMQLAALARSRGDVAAAEQYVREAAQLAEAQPAAAPIERAEMFNALGTIVAAGGNLTRAEETLRQAEALAPPGSAILAQVLNNRAAITALRGDVAEARVLYQSALELIPATADQARRAIVETNLSLIESAR